MGNLQFCVLTALNGCMNGKFQGIAARRKGLRPVSSDLASGHLYRSYVDNLISNSKYDRAKQLGLSPNKVMASFLLFPAFLF